MNSTRPFHRGHQLGALALVAIVPLALAGPAWAHARPDYRKQRTHVEKRARRHIGAPYSYGGSSPRGFDCSGFTRWVFAGHGASLPHSSMGQFNLARRDGYKRVWKRSNLEVGDLVFHKTTGARVGHAGIYIGRGRFVSSTSSGGVRVRSLYDPYYWGPRWVGATRVPTTARDPRDDRARRRDYRIVDRKHAGPDGGKKG